jgi:integrase
LAKPLKLARDHHAAMAYEDVAAFVGRLRESGTAAAQAIEICILTAVRSGDIFGMRWSEVDLDKKVWTLPADRTKAGREQRVPLSSRALCILRERRKTTDGDLVFPGKRKGEPMSDMTSCGRSSTKARGRKFQLLSKARNS